MADEISVSMHIGSGKNAINNMDKIKRADLHNNRKYKNNKNEQIDLSYLFPLLLYFFLPFLLSF